ncbi:glucose-1-phosphate adenylyltransferase [Vibrio cholerae]|uniref:Glucose-1-phosphate adenylyltransferase n=2 Tax=Vibrio TaxID=662 RepID=A0A2U3B7S7_9VIBR|nr:MULTISPECIES: glucose-1-phosphate adenylyltransferase [Vibrio]EKO3631979.1 glucose-1-phosphate adenylyltransferase [Vibrio metschnikovii]EKO3642465.1 glucose-1-phosphate adenylyltransferase [Vibrio metschnikovii]EKO3670261.1 glucose-1-phosphate adenylyltransferase [Vibrio metschnikovii]EKO3728961.1 glucose-1-phosphate adenylyltransferase [Vibrio metschnikovii]EKO3764287.1 glucose-1-phosphate adenylyltransferase [Vibrio metschnikovii]
MPQNYDRHISNLTKDTYALILAGGRGSRLFELTDFRAKPAVYFGGKFRIIDFPLSNCFNSGIDRVGIATQYKSHSLIRHISRGWVSLRAQQFVEILPASQRTGDDWYAGTADAVYQNIDIIRSHRPKYILILSGDHVYRMDYGTLLAEHVANNADMTVCCLEVDIEEAAGSFGVLTVDSKNKIVAFDEKPAQPNEIPNKPNKCLASMGNYLFNADFLFDQLLKDVDVQGSTRDFGHDIIPSIINKSNVFAYSFKDPDSESQPYWRDVGTLDSFWEANMELVTPKPQLDLYDKDWPIWTYQEQLPPAKFIFDNDERRGMAVDSTVSGGCIISGSTIRKSLLYSSVHAHSYSLIEESVLLHGSHVGEHAKLKRVILDSYCCVPAGLSIGYDKEQDEANGFRVTEKGITLVTKTMLENLAK